MKKFAQLKKKSGFSLAECILAIAVFSVMMLMVMIMISNALTQQRSNMAESRGLNDQNETLAAGSADFRDAYQIKMNFGTPISGDVIFDVNRMGMNTTVMDANGYGLELNMFDFTPGSPLGSANPPPQDPNGGHNNPVINNARVKGTKGLTDISVAKTAYSGMTYEITVTVSDTDASRVSTNRDEISIILPPIDLLGNPLKATSITVGGGATFTEYRLEREDRPLPVSAFHDCPPAFTNPYASLPTLPVTTSQGDPVPADIEPVQKDNCHVTNPCNCPKTPCKHQSRLCEMQKIRLGVSNIFASSALDTNALNGKTITIEITFDHDPGDLIKWWFGDTNGDGTVQFEDTVLPKVTYTDASSMTTTYPIIITENKQVGGSEVTEYREATTADAVGGAYYPTE